METISVSVMVTVAVAVSVTVTVTVIILVCSYVGILAASGERHEAQDGKGLGRRARVLFHAERCMSTR